MTALVAENLGISLGGRTVVQDVALRLSAGELVGVVGPNGAGKSTLLRALAGLIPYRGSIQWDNQEMREVAPAQLAKSRSYLPQGGTVHWPLTVRAVTALGRFPFGDAATVPGEAAVARAMTSAGVAQLADRPMDQLSGGERARALLSRALAAETLLLVADEPAAQLDPRHAWEALDVLRAKAAGGALVVVALHDLTATARLCDKVLVMAEGRAQAFGVPGEILTSDLLHQVFGVDAHIGLKDGAPFVVPLKARAAGI